MFMWSVEPLVLGGHRQRAVSEGRAVLAPGVGEVARDLQVICTCVHVNNMNIGT